MIKITNFRFRKCSDVGLEEPYLEVLDQNEVAVFDISKADDGSLQLLFYPEASGKSIGLDLLERIFSEARKVLK